jgi:hypothetical protein
VDLLTACKREPRKERYIYLSHLSLILIFKLPFFSAQKLVLYINPNKKYILLDCNGVSPLKLSKWESVLVMEKAVSWEHQQIS